MNGDMTRTGESIAADGAAPGTIGRLLAVFTSPGTAFAHLNHRPRHRDWLIPLIIAALVAGATTWYTMPAISDYSMEMARRSILQNPELTAEQRQQMLHYVGRSPDAFSGLAAVGASFGVLLLAVIQALVLLGLANLLLGGNATFRKTFAVVANASLIQALGAVVMVPLILWQGTPEVALGLNLLLPDSTEGGFLGNLLSTLNVFGLWQYAVVSIGLAAVAGLPIRKAAGGVFAVYAIYALAAAAMAGVFMPTTQGGGSV